MSYFEKEPELFSEQECIDALKDVRYNSARKAEVAERLAELQRKRRKSGTSSPDRLRVTVQDRQPMDGRKVRYATQNTWHDLKARLAGAIATGAFVYDWLAERNLIDKIPFNSAIFWSVFLASLSVVFGVWAIHLFEERDIMISRGNR